MPARKTLRWTVDQVTAVAEVDHGGAAQAEPANHYSLLKQRFVSWWNGSLEGDARPVRRAIAQFSAEAEPEPYWSKARLTALERIWGAGFLLPGGEALARQLFAVLGLTSKKSLLDLNANLGGTARSLASRHNLWMDAVDPDERLAAEGYLRSRVAGLAKRVPITHASYATLELRPRRYDAIYCRELLFAVACKDRLLDECVVGLKDNGQVLIIDYVLAPGVSPNDVDPTILRPGESAHVWSADRYKGELRARGFKLFLSQDMSEDYLAAVHEAWLKAPEIVRRDHMSHREVDYVMDEGKIWLARCRAIETGVLRVTRFHAKIEKGD